MKFDSYFNLMIAYAFKTVLTMVNDDAWRATGDNSETVRFLFNVNSHASLYGVGKVRLVWLVKNFIEPQVGKIQLCQYIEIFDHMLETGDIEKTKIGINDFFHLSAKEVSDKLYPRKV